MSCEKDGTCIVAGEEGSDESGGCGKRGGGGNG